MAIVLKEGKINKHMAWFTTCSTCGSELKILQGDPIATDDACYNCDANQYYIRYICPVCKTEQKAYTKSPFRKAEPNARYEEIILEEADRNEMATWEEVEKTLTEEDKKWINDRSRL